MILFLFFFINVLLLDGYALDIVSGKISLEPYKYLHNMLAMPLVMIPLLMGVIMILASIIRVQIKFEKCKERVIWIAGIGTVLVVYNLLLLAGFNNTAYYPSTTDLQSSLTIFNSSSSYYTLKIMSYVSLMIPFVMAYTWYVWKAINNRKIDEDEINNSHGY